MKLGQLVRPTTFLKAGYDPESSLFLSVVFISNKILCVLFSLTSLFAMYFSNADGFLLVIS